MEANRSKIGRRVARWLEWRTRIEIIASVGNQLAMDDAVFRSVATKFDDYKNKDVGFVVQWMVRAHFFRLASGLRQLLDNDMATHSLLVFLTQLKGAGLNLFDQDTFVHLYTQNAPAWQLEEGIIENARSDFARLVGTDATCLHEDIVNQDILRLIDLQKALFVQIENEVVHLSRNEIKKRPRWQEYHDAVESLEQIVSRYVFLLTQSKMPQWCDDGWQVEINRQVERFLGPKQ